MCNKFFQYKKQYTLVLRYINGHAVRIYIVKLKRLNASDRAF